MRDILHRLKLKMFIMLSLVYLSVGLLGGMLFYFLFPEYYFHAYPAIVIFYWATGIITNYVFDHNKNAKPEKLLSMFMMSRMIKFVLTLIFLAIIVKLVLEEQYEVVFAITLMCNYILYTSLELYIYYLYNKRLTKDANKEEHS